MTTANSGGHKRVTVGFSQKVQDGKTELIAPGTLVVHSDELAPGECSYSGQVLYYGGNVAPGGA